MKKANNIFKECNSNVFSMNRNLISRELELMLSFVCLVNIKKNLCEAKAFFDIGWLIKKNR